MPARTAHAPAAAMSQWLTNATLPDDFAARDEVEMREFGDDPAVLRSRGVDLFSEEIRRHIDGGMQVVRIALDWKEQLSFVLGEDLCLRRMRFADALVKENDEVDSEDRLARLDADFALMAPALTALQDRLMALFGGEELAS
jgi:recombination associated protein RdgC